MKPNKVIGIYKIESPTGRIYIGQSWDMMERWRSHKKDRNRFHYPICRSFKKYGANSHKFSILHILPKDVSQNVMDNYEYFYINSFRDCGFVLLNAREAGSHGKFSEVSKIKLSNSLKGRVSSRKGVKMSDGTKLRLSIAHTGKVQPRSIVEKRANTRKKNFIAKRGLPSGVIKIYWPTCNYFFIGGVKCVDGVLGEVRAKFKKNNFGNKKLQAIYNEYGNPLVEILEQCNFSELSKVKKKYLDQYFHTDGCCNMSANVDGRGLKHTEEAKKIIGEKSKLKVYTEEYRKKLSIGQINRHKKSPESAKQYIIDSSGNISTNES